MATESRQRRRRRVDGERGGRSEPSPRDRTTEPGGKARAAAGEAGRAPGEGASSDGDGAPTKRRLFAVGRVTPEKIHIRFPPATPAPVAGPWTLALLVRKR